MRTGEIGMLSQKELDTKTNEELLILYKQTNDQKIKQTLVLRYIYIVKNIAMQMRGIYLGFSQIDDIYFISKNKIKLEIFKPQIE